MAGLQDLFRIARVLSHAAIEPQLLVVIIYARLAMNTPDDVSIAGSKKIKDWKIFRSKLVNAADQNLWRQAFHDYFHRRIELRYLLPVKTLQEHGGLRGEGFSIMAIQCSLIEFLESTVQGISYRYVRNIKDLGQYEYCDSKKLFMNFLMVRSPFANNFNDGHIAKDFYEGVRCGLLHEARTKNGWIIRGHGLGGDLIRFEQTRKIVYRNNVQSGLLKFIDWYGKNLPLDQSLQRAFVRKFDSLCE